MQFPGGAVNAEHPGDIPAWHPSEICPKPNAQGFRFRFKEHADNLSNSTDFKGETPEKFALLLTERKHGKTRRVGTTIYI